jgi:hypothetical protein
VCRLPSVSEPKPLNPVERRHLEALSDEIGIMQHARGPRPDPLHGYCTDDVARALQVDLLQQRAIGWEPVAESAWRHLRFLEEAFDKTTGRFRNFRNIDGSWRAGVASEDSQGRAMLALGDTMGAAPDRTMAQRAGVLFAQALPMAKGVRALRARASVMLALDAAVRIESTQVTLAAYDELARRLTARFERAVTPTWPWPEGRVTYENALLPRALIAAGSWFGSASMLGIGVRTLDWLVAEQTAPAGHFSPIGNGWWARGGEKSRFDQQPIEATATLLAAETAFTATGDVTHQKVMERAYAWFLGGNDLGIDIAEPRRGAGYDGLTRDGINTNQGAESTLMWLMALEHIRAMRAGDSSGRALDASLVTASIG